MVRDRNKPRGAMTPYSCFVRHCKLEHRYTTPGRPIVFLEFTKECSAKWKVLPEAQKQRFKEMAQRDRQRYNAEMRYHNQMHPQARIKKRKKKQRRLPNAPQRPLSPFFWFSNDERAKVKQENPNITVGEMSKALGRRWAAAAQEAKDRYINMAKQDSERYQREILAFRRPQAAAVPFPAPAAHVPAPVAVNAA